MEAACRFEGECLSRRRKRAVSIRARVSSVKRMAAHDRSRQGKCKCHQRSARSRPKLTSRALRCWAPALVRHAPSLMTAYLVPGRVPPTIREAAMLGVISVNRCQACESVHGRWAKGIGLHIDDLSPREAAAYGFGQRLATSGPHNAAPPADMSERHQRELLAVSILMELANLAGNRFLPPSGTRPTIQIGDTRTARLLDLGMRAADRTGIGRARTRVAGQATGDVLEIGVGTGVELPRLP